MENFAIYVARGKNVALIRPLAVPKIASSDFSRTRVSSFSNAEAKASFSLETGSTPFDWNWDGRSAPSVIKVRWIVGSERAGSYYIPESPKKIPRALERREINIFSDFFKLAIPPQHSLDHAMDYNDILDRAGSLTHRIRPRNIVRTVPCRQHKSNWVIGSERGGSYYLPIEPYRVDKTSTPSLFPICRDIEPQPTALSRQDVEDSLDDFTMELDHEHALFDHEPWGGVPDGIAPHVNDMPILDRIIFEDCIESGEKVQAPHPNLYDIKYYKRPETIARKCKCSIEDATNLCRFWSTIGDTPAMVNKFTKWVKDKGVSGALKYFGNLATQLSEVESVSPEEFIEGLHTDPSAPDPYKYHPIGEPVDDPEQSDYYETAPDWVKGILKSIETITTIEAVSEMGKTLYEYKLGMHAGTIWMHYNERKAELTPGIAPVSEKAQQIIGFIGKCRTKFRLGKYGRRLYELQAEVKTQGAELMMAESDFSPIWEAYKEKKESLGS
jgi:hypothetical protein